MPSLSSVQARFSAALFASGAPPPDIAGPDGEGGERRFAVYRNNVLAGLTNSVTECFPAVQRIVGAEFMQAMARVFVTAHPPLSPVLLDYGAGFADFIAAFPPAASLPYLGDVARVERAWREAYNAAEAPSLDPSALLAVAESDLAAISFALHPSLRLVRSLHPVVTIWHMNAGEGPVAAVDFSVAEDALILRPDAEVYVRVVPPGGAEFVAALREGDMLGEAAAKALSADDRFDLAGNLAGLVAAGALSEIRR